jgi:hypothetical protein
MVIFNDTNNKIAPVMPNPSLDDPLPSVSDSVWENSDDDLPVPGGTYVVSSIVPKDADSFCRQVQASRLMGIVQEVIRVQYDKAPAATRARVFEVDRMLQETLGRLLFDCDGGCTQYCGPISLCIT